MCASHTRIFNHFLIIFIIILRPAFLDLASSFHLFVEMKGKTKERRKEDESLVRLAAALGPCCLKVTSRERQPVSTKSEGKYYKIEKKGGKERERDNTENGKFFQYRAWNCTCGSTSAQRVTKVTGKRKKETKSRVRKDEEAWGGWIRVCLTWLTSYLSKPSLQTQIDPLFFLLSGRQGGNEGEGDGGCCWRTKKGAAQLEVVTSLEVSPIHPLIKALSERDSWFWCLRIKQTHLVRRSSLLRVIIRERAQQHERSTTVKG